MKTARLTGGSDGERVGSGHLSPAKVSQGFAGLTKGGKREENRWMKDGNRTKKLNQKLPSFQLIDDHPFSHFFSVRTFSTASAGHVQDTGAWGWRKEGR